ncbi:hypothetical protein [Saccharopolyspora hattusasensis]|uniref:hypothetical protein n=1 Tax=Saccharopolyspora hattusasensis TaxID=1128679 RepID=UPI003D967212
MSVLRTTEERRPEGAKPMGGIFAIAIVAAFAILIAASVRSRGGRGRGYTGSSGGPYYTSDTGSYSDTSDGFGGSDSGGGGFGACSDGGGGGFSGGGDGGGGSC